MSPDRRRTASSRVTDGHGLGPSPSADVSPSLGDAMPGSVGLPAWTRVVPLALVLLVAIAAGAWFGLRSPDAVPVVPMAADAGAVEAGRATPIDTGREIVVHVAGAVVRPGLVRLPERARVADAVAAAGGAVREADLAALNLAAGLSDGDRLLVPVRGSLGEGPGSSGAPAGSGGHEGPVDVNTAGLEELQRLPGVGPVLAGRILSHREAHGPFEAVEDLLGVPGIGEGKLAALRDAVIVR